MNLQVENPLGLAKQTDKPLAQKVFEAHMPRADSKAGKISLCQCGYQLSWRNRLAWKEAVVEAERESL